MNESLQDYLGAYLDGELSESQRAEVEAALLADPELAAELERLRTHDALLKAAFAEDIPEASDPATLALFGLADPAPKAAPGIPEAANENTFDWRRWALPAGGAVAAALLIFVMRTPGQTDPWARPAFSAALDDTASLQLASIGEDSTLEPQLTFRAADGRYCREFRLRSDKAEWNRDGIACRSGGGWKNEVLTVAGRDRPDPNAIEMAGGESDPALDRAVERLGGTSPLDIEAEGRLIASDWGSSKK